MKVNDQLGLPIWSRDGSHADFWRTARVTVQSGNQYRVMFELTGLQYGTASDRFGLDDIYFTDGSCQDSTDVNGICTFSGGDSCGFFVNSTNPNFGWKVFNPITSSQPPLLIYDHTSEGVGSGYMYVQSENTLRFNDTTSLFSPLYQPLDTTTPNASTRCLEFYFYLQGTDAITLNVRTWTSSVGRNLLWSRNYEHVGFWWKAEVNIQSLVPYQYHIDAVVGNRPERGLAAIDDVGMRNGACSR